MIAPEEYRSVGEPEYHASPDGALALTIVDNTEGDPTVSFHGFQWHTHASMLAELSGLAPQQALRQYVADILEDRAIIAVLTIGGEIDDIWVTDSPETDVEHQQHGEHIQFRYWSGRKWEIQDN